MMSLSIFSTKWQPQHKERVLRIVVGLATLLEDALEQIHLYSLTVRPFQQLYCVKYSSSLNSYVMSL